jgi:hypothetical protein
MTASDGSCDFLYVHTDIPKGMTIREWRAQRAANRPTPDRWWPRSCGIRARASVLTVWRAAAHALAWPRFARVRARGGRHRAPRRAAPPSGGVPA